MVIRVLSRRIFHFPIVSASKQVFPPPILKPRSFSSKSNDPIHNSPEIPQNSQQANLNSLWSLFHRYGFPPSELNDFLNKNRFLLQSNSSDVEKSMEILQDFKFSSEAAVSMVCSCPRVLELAFLENWKMKISEFGVPDLSPVAIRNILEVSRKFDLNPDEISCWVHRFKSLGFSGSTVCSVLEVYPLVTMTSEDQIRDKMIFLERIGIQRKGIDWILGKFPGVLAFDLKKRLEPLLDEFNVLGYSLAEVKKEIVRDPRVLGLEVGELSQCFRILRSLKCRISVKEKIFRDGAFRAGFNVKLRVDCLCKYGLIRREAFSILWKEPRVILYDIKDIERKIEFLVDKRKFDVQWLVEVPEYLGVNFDKQIVPRYNVIEYLRSKGGLGDELRLKNFINLSRMKFYNLYVKPYPECEKLYGRFAGEVESKDQHPVGMWKLFKPQKYPESDVDVKNMRSFMKP